MPLVAAHAALGASCLQDGTLSYANQSSFNWVSGPYSTAQQTSQPFRAQATDTGARVSDSTTLSSMGSNNTLSGVIDQYATFNGNSKEKHVWVPSNTYNTTRTVAGTVQLGT